MFLQFPDISTECYISFCWIRTKMCSMYSTVYLDKLYFVVIKILHGQQGLVVLYFIIYFPSFRSD